MTVAEPRTNARSTPLDVFGRNGELATIARFLERSGEGMHILVLEGETGSGKTTLWIWAVEEARRSGNTVLTARPAQTEQLLAYAGLRDLLDGLPDVLPLLPGPLRHALDVALLHAAPGRDAVDHSAVAFATLTTLRLLARDGPVVVAIDDAHWLDPSSARALGFATRRLSGDRVALLVSARSESQPPARAYLPWLPDAAVERLVVAGLAEEPLRDVLRTRLGFAPTPTVLSRIQETSGGNPFFALEIGRAILYRPDVPLLPGQPLPVPYTVRELLRDRLAELSDGTRHVLLFVASMASPTRAVLQQAVPPGTDVEAHLAEAVDGGVLQGAGDPIRFSHPLLAAVTYEGATARERREVHRRLALCSSEEEERARHLALASVPPDAAVAEALEAAAHGSRTRCAFDEAAELLALARRFTPAESGDDRRRRTLAEADARALVGDAAAATRLLQDVIASEPSGRTRATALYRLYVASNGLKFEGRYASEHAGESLSAVLAQALREADDDEALRASILEARVFDVGASQDLASALSAADVAVAAAERLADPIRLARTLAARGNIRTMLGDPLARDELTRAAAMENVSRDERRSSSEGDALATNRTASYWLAVHLVVTDELSAARERLEQLRVESLDQADLRSLTGVLGPLVLVEWRAGNWRRAAQYAEEQGRLLPIGSPRSYFRALVDASLGDLNTARAVATAALSGASQSPQWVWATMHRELLGFVELSLGDHAAAHRWLAPLVPALLKRGFGEPNIHRHAWDDVEALIALGELDGAEEMLRALERQAEATRRLWAEGAAHRYGALLLLARGRDGGALERAGLAVAAHERLGQPFELARSVLTLGRVQRRIGLKASSRETLQRAAELFESLPAPLWARQARDEMSRLRLSVAASRDPLGLTDSERQVAELAAAGRSNQEIAEELVLSVKTVEGTLTRVYEKLGVRSRTQLSVRLRGLGGSEDGRR